jgi:hypothetical protein
MFCTRVVMVPGGSLGKSRIGGGKNGKGAGAFQSIHQFAALTAVTKVEKPSAETAISTYRA